MYLIFFSVESIPNLRKEEKNFFVKGLRTWPSDLVISSAFVCLFKKQQSERRETREFLCMT